MFHVHSRQYNLIAPFCDSLIKCSEFLSDYPNLLSVNEKSALLKVFSAYIMHHRMEQEYEVAAKAYRFCIENLSDGCGNYYKRFILHQNARALLMYSMDRHTNPNAIKSHYPDKIDIEPKEIFMESIDIFRLCLPFELTANTLAQIFSTPKPSWLLSEKWVKCDQVRAFSYYKKTYDLICDENYPFPPNGDDVVYTLHEMAFMLITGRILIDNGKFVEGTKSPLNRTDDIGKATMRYAEEILDHTKGQLFKHLSFQRGIVALYNGNEDNAQECFDLDEEYFLTKIVRYKLLEEKGLAGSNPELKLSITETLKRFETKGYIYWLEDAKRMGWVEEV